MICLDVLGTLALRGPDGGELRSVLAQPKRLALLAYLAVESAHGFQRRDRILALFWPELDQAQARQSLRQSLYFLRRALGDDVIVSRGTEEVGIAPAALRCDVGVFCDLLDAGSPEEALATYRGEFLAGFFVADASPEFEQWLDATRAKLRERSLDAARTLSAACERRGRLSEAVHWSRYAARQAPDDERSLQRLVALLDRQGDRAGALRAYAEFADRLAGEFGVEPSTETRALLDAVRGREPAAVARAPTSVGPANLAPANLAPADLAPADRAPVAARAGADAVEAPAAVPGAPPPATRREARRRVSVTLGFVAVAAFLAVVAWRVRPPHPAPPVLAVGWVQDPSGADTGASVRSFAELLATDLGRVQGLHVVSHARLEESLVRLGASDATPSAISEAARRAGATELLEAVLARASNGGLHLGLRRVNLASGVAQRADTLDGATVFELADRATQRVASDLDLRPPTQPVTDVTTTSLAAERLYEEGLRAFYQNDLPVAVRLFHAALGEDSAFAMAAYYAALAEKGLDGVATRRDLVLAVRLSDRVSERERLVIRQAWADQTNDPAQLAIAESLETRYPDEPGSELALGRALQWTGSYLESVPHLRRAVHLDTLSLAGTGPICRACEAIELIVDAFVAADSMGAAEREAREWTRLQPRSTGAWWKLSSILGRRERYDSALAAEQTAERFSGSAFDYVLPRVLIALRSGQYAVADALLANLAQNGNREKRSDALWWTVISLRDQGRLRDALDAALRLERNDSGSALPFGSPGSVDAVAEAQVLFEMGRYARAATIFDSIGHLAWQPTPDFPRQAPGLLARHRIWMTTHVATALAAAGDTARLAGLADSLRAWSVRSAYQRDRVLYHYVRGLLLAARGMRAQATEEFRSALVLPVEGYSRVNYELAKAFLAQGQPGEAIPVLQAALEGPIESTQYYLTYPELHALLGAAFERAGEPDSALVHYGRTLAAWRHADPEYQARVASIQARVDSLQRLGRAGTHR